MLVIRLLLAVGIWLPFSAAQSDNSTSSCSATPFTLEIENQELESGIRTWGVLFQIGNPVQRVSLVPSTVVNSTLVNQYVPLCKISNTTLPFQCESIRGGFFYDENSTSWRSADLKTANISREDPTWDHFNPEGPITEIGYDDIQIRGSEEFTLVGAGIALNQRGWQSNAGMLGLGKDSVFLDDVVAQNRSPSRSWGLDSGSRSLVNGRNGELVIGGYNKARVKGDWKEFDISNMSGARPCPLRLKDTSVSIAACIEPYDNRFRWTAEMIKNWKEATGFDETLVDPYTTVGQDLAFIEPGLPYDKNKTQNWSLRISLAGGYSTTVTYDEMQMPLQGFNKEGRIQNVEGITNVAIFNNATARDEDGTLGKIFLSRTYLRVDYETGKFYLAPADTDPSPSEPRLEAMKPPQCTPPPGGDGGGKKAPIGAIVGGVVGGAAFAILLVAFLVWYGKRRRRLAEERRGQAASQAPVRPMSISGSGAPEAANGMASGWHWFVGPPTARDERQFSQTSQTSQTSTGHPLMNGESNGVVGVSPRGSTQVVADGSELRRNTTATGHTSVQRVPTSPRDITRAEELPGDVGWPVPPGRETAP